MILTFSCRGNCMPMDAVFKAMKIYDNSGDMCAAIHDSYAPRLVFSYLYPDGSARHVRDSPDPSSGGLSRGQLVHGLKDANSSPQLNETKAPRDKPAVQRNVGNSSAANKAAQWDSLTSVRRGQRK